jgi:hypothetical protein
MNARTLPGRLLLVVSLAALVATGCTRDGHDHDGPEPAPAAGDAHDGRDHHGHDDHDHHGHDHAGHDEGPADVIPPIPEGARRVAVTVSNEGYDPARIAAAPGEEIVLVLTRVVDSACTRDFRVRGTETRATLPVDEPVEIPVKAPEEGEQGFHCGHDMLRGAVVVEAAE